VTLFQIPDQDASSTAFGHPDPLAVCGGRKRRRCADGAVRPWCGPGRYRWPLLRAGGSPWVSDCGRWSSWHWDRSGGTSWSSIRVLGPSGLPASATSWSPTKAVSSALRSG